MGRAICLHSRRTRECFHAIREGAKPMICAINGAALGSGLAMVASSDILVASEKATLGWPEVSIRHHSDGIWRPAAL